MLSHIHLSHTCTFLYLHLSSSVPNVFPNVKIMSTCDINPRHHSTNLCRWFPRPHRSAGRRRLPWPNHSFDQRQSNPLLPPYPLLLPRNLSSPNDVQLRYPHHKAVLEPSLPLPLQVQLPEVPGLPRNLLGPRTGPPERRGRGVHEIILLSDPQNIRGKQRGEARCICRSFRTAAAHGGTAQGQP